MQTKEKKRNILVLSMGATFEAIEHEKIIDHLIPFVDIDIHLSQNYIFNTSVFIPPAVTRA